MFDAYAEVGVLQFSRWIFNCYVIEDGGAGSPVVVDAGMPSTAADVVRHLGLCQDMEALSILTTHGHSDHLGGVATLAAATPVQLHLPELDREYLAGQVPRSPTIKAIARILPVMRETRFSVGSLVEAGKAGRSVGFGSHAPFRVPVPASEYLTDGQSVASAPDWAVIHTPGHTDDSTSYYNAKTRTLFSGDAVVTIKGRAWFTPEYVDQAIMADTEARLRDLQVDHLFPGHGRPISGTDLLRDAIPHGRR